MNCDVCVLQSKDYRGVPKLKDMLTTDKPNIEIKGVSESEN